MMELLTVAEMTEADRRTIAAGTPGATLMDRAGVAVADVVSRRAELGTPIVVVCGPGNNGGDGFVAARVLANRGFSVRVVLLGSLSALKGDAAAAAGRWRGAVDAPGPAVFDDARLIVDALFGAGLDRPLGGEAAALVARMNAARCPVVAVDLPSGIHGDTGAVMGIAVEAIETVTFCRRKLGHLLMPGRLHCGRVRVADIGISDETIAEIAPRARPNTPALWREALPVPTLADHKYTRGHALIVSGPAGRTGAARLAARAALRAGAGLVTLASPPAAMAENAHHLTAIMVREAAGAEGLAALLADARFKAIGIGPALGEDAAARAAVEVALGAGRPVVLDADAITLFAGRTQALHDRVAADPARPVILTPHSGEFERLFSAAPETFVRASKLPKAQAAAAALGVTLVLKGADTIVATPDGRVAIADNAVPWLATAGSGDVLAGMITALLTQGMPAFEAAAAAVWLHGEAGREAGPGLIAEDLPEALPKVLRTLYAELDVDLTSGRRLPAG